MPQPAVDPHIGEPAQYIRKPFVVILAALELIMSVVDQTHHP